MPLMKVKAEANCDVKVKAKRRVEVNIGEPEELGGTDTADRSIVVFSRSLSGDCRENICQSSVEMKDFGSKWRISIRMGSWGRKTRPGFSGSLQLPRIPQSPRKVEKFVNIWKNIALSATPCKWRYAKLASLNIEKPVRAPLFIAARKGRLLPGEVAYFHLQKFRFENRSMER